MAPDTESTHRIKFENLSNIPEGVNAGTMLPLGFFSATNGYVSNLARKYSGRAKAASCIRGL